MPALGVTIEAMAEEGPLGKEEDDPTGWKAARGFIGIWKDAPEGSSASLWEDHDQAVYRRK